MQATISIEKRLPSSYLIVIAGRRKNSHEEKRINHYLLIYFFFSLITTPHRLRSRSWLAHCISGDDHKYYFQLLADKSLGVPRPPYIQKE
jgi:hypothetical protein